MTKSLNNSVAKVMSFQSIDGLLLHGYLFKGNNNKCVLHVHGLAGNFYSSMYHPFMAKSYKKLGYDYFVFNNRGSEYIKRLKNGKTGQSAYYGFAFELFEESYKDIIGAIDCLKKCGYQKIILQGHSSGCQKIIYTLSKTNPKINIDYVILISPCDDVGLAIQKYGNQKMKEKIKFAQIYKQGLLPLDFFFDMPISKKTFLSHYGPDSKFNIFHYHDRSKPFNELSHNKKTTLIVFGEKDYVIDFDIVRDVYEKFNNYTVKVIQGADHKYRGKEKELAKEIYDYVRQTNPV